MLNWLRNKLRIWLGINEDNARIGRAVKDIEKDILCKTDARFRSKGEMMAKYIDKTADLTEEVMYLNKELDLFKSMCQVGTDVHMRTDSWAVICLDGKPEYVNFVRLDSRDARDIKYFLKRFDKSQRITDAPYGFVDSFKWQVMI